MKYFKEQEVTVITTSGVKAGNAIIESFNVHNDKCKIRFQYERAGQEELIEVPGALLIGGVARDVFEKKNK